MNGIGPTLFNDAGQTAFLGVLSGPGVNSTNNQGIYSEGGGTLAEVARESNQVPGAELGVMFSSFDFGSPALNTAGQTAFRSFISGPGLDGTNNTGIFSEEGGTLAEVARTGNQAPGADPGVVFDRLDFGSPTLDAAGHTAFFATLSGQGVDGTNNSGIYSDRGGALAEVARAGNQAPGSDPDVLFSFFDSPVLNAAGQTAFKGVLTGTGVDSTNDRGIYSEGGGTLAEVARTGNQAPGANPNVLFRFFDLPVLNAAGQIAFVSELTGTGVNSTNDYAIYATSRDGLLVEIVRKGELIDVNDEPMIDDLRTISGLGIATNSGNEDGRRSAFNDLGQIAFSATFTDGSQGIFVSNRVAFTPVSGDFDLNGDVDGLDFLMWQRNPTVGDLSDWQLNYGFDSSALSTASVVPEPAAASLLVLWLPVLFRRRNTK